MNTAYFGIDVSKAKCDICWLREPTGMKIKTKVLANDADGCEAVLAWIEAQLGQQETHCVVTLEATGVYHERIAYYLHSKGIEVRLTQPQQFHHYVVSHGVRSKTDKRDSILLARYGSLGHGRCWEPEPEPIRHLKALLQRVESLRGDIRREENRLEAVTISGVSAVVESSIRDMISALEEEAKKLEQEIDTHMDGHDSLQKDALLLKTIPGIGDVTSRYLVSVLRSRAFEKASQCAAYLGVIPVSRSSGSSVRSKAVLSKAGNSLVRAKLYMAAVVAIRCNPDAKVLYERLLARGKAKMSALGAVMRKLVHISFGVLKHQKEYCAQAS